MQNPSVIGWIKCLRAPTKMPKRRRAGLYLKIGTDAIPSLLQMLRAHGSPLKTKLLTWASQHSFGRINYVSPETLNFRAEIAFGYIARGDEAAGSIPELIRILDQHLSPESEASTARILGGLRDLSKGGGSIKASANRGEKPNESDRITTPLYALGRIHAKRLMPSYALLIKELRDPSEESRMDAVSGLGDFQNEAKSAVPALVEMFNQLSVHHQSTLSPKRFPLSQLYFRAALQWLSLRPSNRIDPETCRPNRRQLDKGTAAMLQKIPGMRRFGGSEVLE